MKAAVIVAMEKEEAVLRRALGGAAELVRCGVGKVNAGSEVAAVRCGNGSGAASANSDIELARCGNGPDVELVCSGVGKVNAARCATELILGSRPGCIVSTGVAGAMDERLRTGDLVIAAECAFHDIWLGDDDGWMTERFPSDGALLDKALKAAAVWESSDSCSSEKQPRRGRRAFCGLISSGDQFYLGPEEDARIRSLLPDVLACDMESAAIAQVCRHYGVPFISMRIISDVHHSSEQQEDSYRSFWAETDTGVGSDGSDGKSDGESAADAFSFLREFLSALE